MTHDNARAQLHIKGSVNSEFLIFAITNCIFLTDLRSKTMTCYTFSVRPTIPESRNIKVAMKKFDEEENEDFCEEEYLNFEELSFDEEKPLWKNFCGRWCIFYQTKNRISENFCKSIFVSKSLK